MENNFAPALSPAVLAFKSLSMDGADDTAVFTTAPNTSNFNLAFWAKLSAITNGDRLIDWQDGGPANGITVILESIGGGQFRSKWVVSNGTETVSIIMVSPIVLDVWVHYALTFATNNAKAYIDGVQVGATDTSCSMVGSSNPFAIGSRSGGTSSNPTLKLALPVFQNAAPWSAPQVNALYAQKTDPISIPAGASYYLLNNNGNDESGNGNILTISGATYTTDIPS